MLVFGKRQYVGACLYEHLHSDQDYKIILYTLVFMLGEVFDLLSQR
jgi:hypothetical protein